jgi:hypothetical protein
VGAKVHGREGKSPDHQISRYSTKLGTVFKWRRYGLTRFDNKL